jgi:Lrp/AsnC family leucine-responsive transcriptional regulator
VTGRRRLALAEAPREQRQLVQAIARVRLAPDKPCGVFEQQLRMAPAVLSAVHVTGDVDYELRLACDGVASLGAVLAGLRGCGGIEVVSTALVLREVPGLGIDPSLGALPRPRLR